MRYEWMFLAQVLVFSLWLIPAGGCAAAEEHPEFLKVGGEKILFSEARQRAESGDSKAQVAMGRYLLFDKKPPFNVDEGLDWLRKAVLQNNTEAMYTLGKALYENSEADLNPSGSEEAIQWVSTGVSLGDWHAMEMLSTFYFTGWGVPRDLAQASYWEGKALESGGAAAELTFSVAHFFGKKAPEDMVLSRQLLRRSAENDFPPAQYLLGVDYAEGLFVKPDFKESRFWLEKAAGHDVGRSTYFLGENYRKGSNGYPHDKAKALEWFEKAAQMGYGESFVSLGYLYLEDIPGHPRDPEKALAMFHKGLEKGDSSAYMALGDFYFKGDGGEQNVSEAYHWFHKGVEKDPRNTEVFARAEIMRIFGMGTSAEPTLDFTRMNDAIQHGNMDAAAILGKFYLAGVGTAKDFYKARRCFVASATGGNGEGKFWAALIPAAGLGGPQDVELAAYWAEMVSSTHVSTNHCLAGGFFLAGTGVVPDLAYGLDLLQKGAMLPTTSCAWLLGEGYRQGRYGLPVDLALASHWYEQAAAHGDLEAMLRLGLIAAGLAGGARESWMDFAEAVRWLQKAGERGSPPAAFLLGILHAKGLGTPQNLDQARRWLRAAQQQGLERAGHLLAIIDDNSESLDAQAEMAAYVSTLPDSLAPPAIPDDLSFFPIPHLPGLPEGFWPRLLVDLQVARKGTSRRNDSPPGHESGSRGLAPWLTVKATLELGNRRVTAPEKGGKLPWMYKSNQAVTGSRLKRRRALIQRGALRLTASSS
ncbi:MAG: sel1 repeat family protein [Magnetococcales bacterium]|nr:sel1 repeat family protein [Magnetococcales bacterium]